MSIILVLLLNLGIFALLYWLANLNHRQTSKPRVIRPSSPTYRRDRIGRFSRHTKPVKWVSELGNNHREFERNRPAVKWISQIGESV